MTGTQVSDGTSEQDHYLIRGGVAGRREPQLLGVEQPGGLVGAAQVQLQQPPGGRLPLPWVELLGAVNFHLDYLARTKLRLRGPAAAERPRLEGRRAALVSFALRFDLVRDEHLALLPSRLGPV